MVSARRIFAALAAGGALLALAACSSGKKSAKSSGPGEVVLFTALDEMFSKPVVRVFEKETGITVRLKTDTEAVKTVGLVSRLIARKAHPEADVFWNNELAQTLVLKEKGVLAPYRPEAARDIPAEFKDPDGYWTGFAARARVILINTEELKTEAAPKTLEDLAAPRFKNRLVIAQPLFGTSFTHAAALFSVWGEKKTQAWYRKLKANGVKFAPGNARARNLVADGEFAVCLTDSDDANGALLKKKPVRMIYPGQAGEGTLVLPNSVALIRGGPNPENAKRLIEFLVSARAEALLARSPSAQMPVRPDVAPYSARFDLKKIKARRVDWAEAAKRFEAVRRFVESELIE